MANNGNIYLVLCISLFGVNGLCSSRAHDLQCQSKKSEGRIKLKVDLRNEQKLQKAVDNGHQPWRLDPLEVACVSLKGYLKKGIKKDQCFLINKSDDTVFVEYRDIKKYTVQLKRIVRRDGIWTAEEIDTE